MKQNPQNQKNKSDFLTWKMNSKIIRKQHAPMHDVYMNL